MGANLGTAVGYLDLDISGFSQGWSEAQRQANTATGNIQKDVGTKMDAAGKTITSAGKTLTAGITTPVVGVGAAIIKVSSDFEASMSTVSAISGATGGDFDKLRTKALEMGYKTKFSASESAEAMKYMAMAGWKTNDMLDGLEGIMNLSAASGEDLATVSDIVTDAMTAFGLSAKDSGHFADVLATASSNANTNVGMLGESFKYVAPVAGALGYSAEDVSVALGLMANSCIKGSQAGTSLRGALTRMVKPTGDAAVCMKQLGINVTNSDGSMKSLDDVMKILRTSFGGLTEEEQAQAAATIFGQEAMSGMLAIINTSEEDYNKLSTAINNADGSAKTMSDTMMNNLSGQVTLLKSALEGLAIQLGEILLPYVKQFVEWLQGLVDKFSSLSKEEQEQIVKIAAVAAAVGPLLVVFGKLMSTLGTIGGTIKTVTDGFGAMFGATVKLGGGFTSAGTSMATVGSQAGPVGAAIGGISVPIVAVVAVIATLVAAFTNLWKTNEDFKNGIIGIWNGIKEKFNEFSQGIVDRLNALGFDFESLCDVFKAIWDGFCNFLAPIFTGVFQEISNALGAVFDVILGILDVFIGLFTGNWGQLWDGVKGIFLGVWNFIKNTFLTILDVLKGIVDVFLGWFGTSWDEVMSGLADFFKGIWNGICDFFSGIVDWFVETFTGFGEAISDFFTGLWEGISEFFKGIWNGITEFLGGVLDGIVETFTGWGEAISEFFSGLWEGLKEIVSTAWLYISTTVETAFEFIAGIVKFAFDLITIPFRFIWENCKDTIISIWNAIKDFVSTTIDTIKNTISNVWETVKTITSTVWNAIKSVIDTIIAAIKNFIVDRFNDIKNAIQLVLNTIKNIITTVWNAIKAFLEPIINAIKEVILRVFNTLKTGIETVMNAIKTVITTIWNAIKTAVTNVVNALKTVITTAFNAIKTTITTVINAIKTVITNVWNAIKTTVTNVVNVIKTTISNVFNAIKTTITNIFNAVKTTVTNVWNAIKSAITTPINVAKTTISNVVDTIKNKVSSGFNAAKETVTTVFNKIKSAITTPINAAKETVTGVIDKIKGAFDFKWSLPKLKLPHISVSGGKAPFGIGGSGSLPKFSIEWYKKAMNGGLILDNPTIFGMSKGGKFLGGGEAGSEAIVGTGSLMSMVKNAASEGYSRMASTFAGLLSTIGAKMNNAFGDFGESVEMLKVTAKEITKSTENSFGYKSYEPFAKNSDMPRTNNSDKQNDNSNGDTFIFNSPKPIDEVEAARQMRIAKQDLAEGF